MVHLTTSRGGVGRGSAAAPILATTLDGGVILKVTLGKGHVLDDHLKNLMQELGNAINESLSDSERIASAIGEIKGAGYDVFLVLEATIGFNKRKDPQDEQMDPETVTEVAPQVFETSGKVRWTSQDHKFLRALKISVDEAD